MIPEIILAGRPNSGKSTLFNRLASAQQKVANYAGCTVEKKTSTVHLPDGGEYEITDLPGLFSLKPNSKDEEVALEYLEEKKRDSFVIFVCDGNNLEQELVLPMMLKKQGIQLAIAVNMMDEVQANKRILHLDKMQDLAGISFFPISAKTGEGVEALRKYFTKIEKVQKTTGENGLLEISADRLDDLHKEARVEAKKIQAVNPRLSSKESTLFQRDQKIDQILLHKIAGPILFFVTMFILFQSIFTWASPLADQLEAGMQFLSELVKTHVAHELLASLLSDGVLAGVGSVLVFVPQIAILFSLIGLLEYSGYLPRIAYMIDRIMKPYGLDGKVFIPLLSSVACAVPGILSTRTIENERTRLMTIMISPLMTCSARLPVYTLLIATFIPAKNIWGLSLQGLVMFFMYAIAVVAALLVALILHKSNFQKRRSSIELIHLPHYRSPDWVSLGKFVLSRINTFLKKAGTIIAAMSILLWALLSFPKNTLFEDQANSEIGAVEVRTDWSADQKKEKIDLLKNAIDAKNLESSVGGSIGKFLEPVFQPIGYDWKLTIGILSSLAAREVFVSTLGTVYSLGNGEEHADSLMDVLKNTKKSDGSAAYTLATCLSLLMFFAFSLQCTSTIGVARRETNSWKIPAIMFAYMFILAYGAAFIAYHIGHLIA